MPIEEWISLSNIFIYRGTGSERHGSIWLERICAWEEML